MLVPFLPALPTLDPPGVGLLTADVALGLAVGVAALAVARLLQRGG